MQPISIASRSNEWVCSPSLAGIAASNPAGELEVSVFWVLCFSGRCLCDGPITLQEQSYRVWSVWVWSRSLDHEDAYAHESCRAVEKKKCYLSSPVLRFWRHFKLYSTNWKYRAISFIGPRSPPHHPVHKRVYGLLESGKNLCLYNVGGWTSGGADGWGISLQARKSWVRFPILS